MACLVHDSVGRVMWWGYYHYNPERGVRGSGKRKSRFISWVHSWLTLMNILWCWSTLCILRLVHSGKDSHSSHIDLWNLCLSAATLPLDPGGSRSTLPCLQFNASNKQR